MTCRQKVWLGVAFGTVVVVGVVAIAPKLAAGAVGGSLLGAGAVLSQYAVLSFLG